MFLSTSLPLAIDCKREAHKQPLVRVQRTAVFPEPATRDHRSEGHERVLSQILLKFECGDRLDTITLRAPQIAETR
jgi:hypothetical protein